MGKIIVLSNTDFINDNGIQTNNFSVNNSDKNATSDWGIFNLISRAKKKFVHNLHIFGLRGKSGLTLLLAIFYYLYIVIEEIFLLALLSIYFVLGATAAILYVVFYEKIIEKLVLKFKKKDHNSSDGDYEWMYSQFFVTEN